jgi:hypothetical protein
MAPKLTGQQLLAILAQVNKDAEDLRALWIGSFPPDLLPPQDWELKNAVRRLPLEDLAEGIKSYLVILSERKATPTTMGALKYICATAWAIREKENPDHEFRPTARRQRNAARDPNSPQWDGEAFGNATPEERQRIMAETIARQKAN